METNFDVKKGIFAYGSGITTSDYRQLIKKGLSAIYIPDDDMETRNTTYTTAISSGFTTVIMAIGWGTWDQDAWKKVIDKFDAPYYYMDEPYAARKKWYMENRDLGEKQAMESVHKDIILRRDYIAEKRPNSKFVIGDIRHILDKRYKPIDGVYYTYTSYTNNIYIPILGKAIPIGLGDQSPAIRRLHKKVGNKIPFVWVFGKHKILCYPDEYHSIIETCKDLRIPMAISYTQDGSEKYKLNDVDRKTAVKYINHFIDEERPYTNWEWWSRFFGRFWVSIKDFTTHWSISKFFDRMF